MYHGNLNGSIKIRYRPDVYYRVSEEIQYKPSIFNDTTYYDCTYSQFNMKFMPLDYLRIRYTRKFMSDSSHLTKSSDGTNSMDYWVSNFTDNQLYDTTYRQQFLGFTEGNINNITPGNIFLSVSNVASDSIGPLYQDTDITNALYMAGMDSRTIDTFAEYTIVKQRGTRIEDSDTSLHYFAIDGTAEILEEGHNS